MQLAHQLILQLDRNFLKTTSFDYMGNRDQLRMIFNRHKAEKGYTAGNAAFDLVRQGKNVQGIAALAVPAAGAFGASVAMPAIPVLRACIGSLSNRQGSGKIAA